MKTKSALALNELSVSYGKHLAVNRVSLNVIPGEIYGLLGPNGSGKSSTLSAIAGTLIPTSGSIEVAGYCRQQASMDYRRKLGIVPQELALYEELSVQDNLIFFGKLYGLRGQSLKQRVQDVLKFIQLSDRATWKIHALSGGMQRRVNLGCALLHEPTLLLLDEPTVGLDITSRSILFDNLRQLRQQGCAMVFTTHHLYEAEQLCDRIGVMFRGQLMAEGTLDELTKSLNAEVQSTRLRIRDTDRPQLEQMLIEMTQIGSAA